MEHLSWCWSYSLGTTGDKPCREYFLLTLSRAVFKQFLRRFCSNDSLKLFSQIPLLHFAFSSNNAASCFPNSYPSETVGHCRPVKQFCAINDKWCWERSLCKCEEKVKWGQSANRFYSQAPSIHYHNHPPHHDHHSHGLNIISWSSLLLYYCEALANTYSGLRKGVRTFVLYDTGSLTETAWFWKCAKTQMTIHFAKDSWSVRQMPKAGVIVDVITMKICVLPCIIRIQSRPSGRSPICRHGKIWRFCRSGLKNWNILETNAAMKF